MLRRKKKINTVDIYKRNEFFLGIWKNKFPHKCENCSVFLGYEPLSYMFDHCLEKSKYPEYEYEEDNIMYLCLECHDRKTRGYLSPIMLNKQKQLKKQYNIQ